MFPFSHRPSNAERERENSYAKKHDHASEAQGHGGQNTAEDYTTSMATQEPGERRLQEEVGRLRESEEASGRGQAADQRPDGSDLHRQLHVEAFSPLSSV